MRLRFSEAIVTLGLGLGVGAIPSLAQVTAPVRFSDAQLAALVNAVQQVPVASEAGLSEWQLANVSRWSQECRGRAITPEQFVGSPVTARWIIACKLRAVLPVEYRMAGNNEAIAVRRTAAWWLSGNPAGYANGEAAAYSQKVLNLYQQKRVATAGKTVVKTTPAIAQSEKPAVQAVAKSSTPPVRPSSTTASAPTPTTPATGTATPPKVLPSSPSRGLTFYDRYMQAGKAAANQRDQSTALLYFKRALDERPDDPYATQAIQALETPGANRRTNPPATVPPIQPALGQPAQQPTRVVVNQPATTVVPTVPTVPVKLPPAPKTTPVPATPVASPAAPTGSVKLTPPPKTTLVPTTPVASPATSLPSVVVSSTPPPASITEQQAIDLVNRWLQAKAEIFAPPFDQTKVETFTTGKLLTSLLNPDGVLAWLKANQGYYRYGTQRLETVERLVATRTTATLVTQVAEDRWLYLNGVVAPQYTNLSTQRVRFTLELNNGIWKISDYRTVDGALLERSPLGGSNPSTR
jgi:hypothetical protein